MSNVNGTCTLRGLDQATLEGYICFHTDQQFSQHATISELKDGDGNDAQLSATNEYLEYSATFVPSGASKAAAKSNVFIAAPLATVTVAGITAGPQTVTGDTDRGFNGDWINMAECSISLKGGENASYTMKLRKYVSVTQNTLLNTPVAAS